MLHRRALLTTAAVAGFIPAAPAILRGDDLPGVTATEIRIGNTMSYSGPVSAYGTLGKAIAARFHMRMTSWLRRPQGQVHLLR